MFVSDNYHLHKIITLYFVNVFLGADAQNLSLGTWTAHLPLQNATNFCQSKNYVYAACENGVIGVDIENNFLENIQK